MRVKRKYLWEIVLVGYDNRKRLDWPLELVVVVLFPRSDNCVQVVWVKTALRGLTTTMQHVYPLEISWINSLFCAMKRRTPC